VTRRQHRLFGRLALVAMLLLASVPTLGRLAASAAPVHVHDGQAMAAMPGMAHADAAAHVPPAHPAHPAHQHDEDCAYCALLGATVPALVSALALPPSLPPEIAPSPWRAPSRRALPPGALGSRGPPAHA
jgi:hypothetical protein